MSECFDQSILAWESRSWFPPAVTRLFASSPRDFDGCGDIVTWAERSAISYDVDNRGLNIDLFFAKSDATSTHCAEANDEAIAILHCRRKNDFSNALALRLTPPTNHGIRKISPIPYGDAWGLRRCFTRLTSSSLNANDITGPIRTTILLDPSRELPWAKWFQPHFHSHLLIEHSLPGAIDFMRLQPSTAWNADTLVMSPLSDAGDILWRWSPTVSFRYSTMQYSIKMDYWDQYRDLELTFAPLEDMDISNLEFTDITSSSENTLSHRGKKFALVKPRTDEFEIFCALAQEIRLGHTVWVLHIGHTSQLSEYVREKEGSDVSR